jgi:hypothetical protein
VRDNEKSSESFTVSEKYIHDLCERIADLEAKVKELRETIFGFAQRGYAPAMKCRADILARERGEM